MNITILQEVINSLISDDATLLALIEEEMRAENWAKVERTAIPRQN